MGGSSNSAAIAGDALARGCDTLVTGGGRQSNHVRLTAAAAARLGLGCVAVMSSAPPTVATGNVVLDHLLGAELEWAGTLEYYELEEAIEASVARLVERGRRPYLIPVGGATPVGALGYVAAVDELCSQ